MLHEYPSAGDIVCRIESLAQQHAPCLALSRTDSTFRELHPECARHAFRNWGSGSVDHKLERDCTLFLSVAMAMQIPLQCPICHSQHWGIVSSGGFDRQSTNSLPGWKNRVIPEPV